MAADDQQYAVSGHDSYQIGQSQIQTTISYTGTQQLTVTHDGDRKRFVAQVRYVREDQGGKTPSHASFVQEMTPAGELEDKANLDPDYLTVLNQPFAIELDPTTMRDILRLRGRVPFDFPSPMTGGSLHGYLERGAVTRLGERPAVAVAFDATGPMAGPLPDQPTISIHGVMRMKGTAYYAVHESLLLALDETLTISGTIKDHSETTPVTIVYSRSIRAGAPPAAMTEARSTPGA